MSFFKRLFRIGKAEANSMIDKLEDPIRMTEQGIRDMKEDLEKSLGALAEVKALAIRRKNDYDKLNEQSTEYHDKAKLLLKRAESGDLEVEEAERLATEALKRKSQSDSQAKIANEERAKLEKDVDQLQASINDLKSNISKWENELKSLRARAKVSDATKNINKQMAEIDVDGTVAMLERMKEKVAKNEALAEAYGHIAESNKSIDHEIEDALDGFDGDAQSALEKLKAQIKSET